MDTFFKTELGFRTLKLRELELNARQRRLLVLIGTEDFKAMSAALKSRIASPELIQQLTDLGLIQLERTSESDSLNSLQQQHISIVNTPQHSPNTNHADATLQAVQGQKIWAQPTEILTKLVQPVIESANKILPAQSSPQNAAPAPSEIQTSLNNNSILEPVQPQHIQPSVAHTPPEPAPAPAPAALPEALTFDQLKHFMIQHLQQFCGLMARQLIDKIQHAAQVPELKSCQMQWITQLQESRIQPKLLNDALQRVNYSMRILQGS